MWYQNIHSLSFSFVTMHASDEWTERQTELRQQYCAMHYMQHGKNLKNEVVQNRYFLAPNFLGDLCRKNVYVVFYSRPIDVAQSTAELLLFPVSENKRPPY